MPEQQTDRALRIARALGTWRGALWLVALWVVVFAGISVEISSAWKLVLVAPGMLMVGQWSFVAGYRYANSSDRSRAVEAFLPQERGDEPTD